MLQTLGIQIQHHKEHNQNINNCKGGPRLVSALCTFCLAVVMCSNVHLVRVYPMKRCCKKMLLSREEKFLMTSAMTGRRRAARGSTSSKFVLIHIQLSTIQPNLFSAFFSGETLVTVQSKKESLQIV